MDPEKQPLLSPICPSVTEKRCQSGFRPLTHDEVLSAQREAPWRRARICLMLLFWTVMAALMSVVVSVLMKSTCSSAQPAVPPVHMSFANLVSNVRSV